MTLADKPEKESGAQKPVAGHAQALSALQKMAKPQPKATGNQPTEEDMLGAGSASGFVGMLAKGQIGGKDPFESLAAQTAYGLQMAREVPSEDSTEDDVEPPENEMPVMPTAPATPSPPAERRARPVQVRYKWLVPITFALAGVLLAIGAWAGGAVVYMANNSKLQFPTDVHYPLISWTWDAATETEGYTQASRMMAWAMLACLPVALGLLVMAEMLRRRIGRDARRARG